MDAFYSSFMQGTISIANLVLLLSFTIMFILFTIMVIQRRKLVKQEAYKVNKNKSVKENNKMNKNKSVNENNKVNKNKSVKENNKINQKG